LIPAGSRLLGLSEIRNLVQPFDPLALAYPWRHSDPMVDALQQTIADLAARGGASRVETYEAIRAAAAAAASLTLTPTARADRHARPRVPYLTEPWYCCAEPTEGQAALI
jgi:hypothetical protein